MKLPHRIPSRHGQGFTLLELLIVMVIIAILAAVLIGAVTLASAKARRVECLALFRSAGNGISNFTAENSRPPEPQSRAVGFDTLYGAPGGDYDNAWIVAVITGKSGTLNEPGGGTESTSRLNPDNTAYTELPYADKNKASGVGEDGIFYDPWGRPVILGINSHLKEQYQNDGQPGYRDEVLDTNGLCQYTDQGVGTSPWVIFSPGQDGEKGKPPSSDLFKRDTQYSGSDDVIHY